MRYCFTLMKEGKKGKLESEKVIAIYNTIIPNYPYVQKFIQFIQEKDIKLISSDLYIMFITFTSKFKDSLDGYDEGSAWPTQIDDFVAWLKK